MVFACFLLLQEDLDQADAEKPDSQGLRMFDATKSGHPQGKMFGHLSWNEMIDHALPCTSGMQDTISEYF